MPIDPGTESEPTALASLRVDLERAVRDGHRVRLTYWVPARDEETVRVVDPRGVVTAQGAAYLSAWCHSAEDDRLFRLDRIHAAEVLDEPAAHREPPTGLDADLFGFDDRAQRVTLRLDRSALWVTEYYQVLDTRPLPDGGAEADLLVADPRWLERLVMRLAPHASVVRPTSWAEAVTARAEAALSMYQAPGVP